MTTEQLKIETYLLILSLVLASCCCETRTAPDVEPIFSSNSKVISLKQLSLQGLLGLQGLHGLLGQRGLMGLHGLLGQQGLQGLLGQQGLLGLRGEFNASGCTIVTAWFLQTASSSLCSVLVMNICGHSTMTPRLHFTDKHQITELKLKMSLLREVTFHNLQLQLIHFSI